MAMRAVESRKYRLIMRLVKEESIIMERGDHVLILMIP